MILRLASSAVLAGLLVLLIRALILSALASRRRTRQICRAILNALYDTYKCRRPAEDDLWQRLIDDGMNRSWEWAYRRQLGRLVWRGRVRRDGDTLSLSKREFRRRAEGHGQDPGMALAVRLARHYWQEQST
jgi:hypothetical protein